MSVIEHRERVRGLVANQVTAVEPGRGGMRLRIGVVAGRRASPTAGGEWTLITTLSSTLRNTQTEHEYVFLDELLQPGNSSGDRRQTSQTITYRILRRAYSESIRIGQKIVPKGARRVLAKLRNRKSYAARLQDAIDHYKLDIVWFMTVFRPLQARYRLVYDGLCESVTHPFYCDSVGP
jgi:hypothetical protein